MDHETEQHEHRRPDGSSATGVAPEGAPPGAVPGTPAPPAAPAEPADIGDRAMSPGERDREPGEDGVGGPPDPRGDRPMTA